MQLAKDRRIPYYFVAFFVVLAMIDGIMVTLAVRTHTGTVAEHPYEAGLAYNRTIEASKMQQALGWKSELNVEQQSAQKALVDFSVVDKNGAIIRVDTAWLEVMRPTQQGHDFNVKLTPVEDHYSAVVDFPMTGLWELRVYVKAGEHSYQQARRIVLQ